MEIKISSDELKKRKLFVATPMFGGMCHGTYARSMLELSTTCMRYGIDMRVHYLFNESLIQRARIYQCDEFIRSGATHMLFIDADIGFNANDVIAMLALQTDDSPYDILAAPYPKKTIAWEKVKAAVDKGLADKDPNVLEQFVGDYVFNPVMPENQTEAKIRIDEPCEVLESGTGFMMIRRNTFEMYEKAFPERKYLPDHVRTANFDGSREIYEYFRVSVDPASRRLLSEDYAFCQDIRGIGGKVWLCPWIQLQHTGTMTFGGSLAALASIGASATADPTKLGTKR